MIRNLVWKARRKVSRQRLPSPRRTCVWPFSSPAEQFMEAPPAHNDVTALVLLRKSGLLRRNRQLKIKH